MADNYGIYKCAVAGNSAPYLLESGTAAIDEGDAITTTGATAGYVQKADGAGDVVIGFAKQKVASPAADGDLSILVDLSKENHYVFPPDAGTVTQALVGTLLDIGADGRSVRIASSTTNDLRVISVDISANTLVVARN